MSNPKAPYLNKYMNPADKELTIRRYELKRYLSERGRLSYIFDLLDDLENGSIEMDGLEIQRKKIALDTRMKLLNKYLPDEKAVEIKNPEGETFDIENTWTIVYKDADGEDIADGEVIDE